jgi:tetratricopeptide (TPR) repeat protein
MVAPGNDGTGGPTSAAPPEPDERRDDGAVHEAAVAQGERAYELFQKGRRFLADRHPAQAAMFLEQALLLAPDKNSIREALGRSYYALGRYGRATREFEELQRRAPPNDYAHFAMARCLLKLEDVAGALRAARLAVAMAPGNADYRRALADCLAAAG